MDAQSTFLFAVDKGGETEAASPSRASAGFRTERRNVTIASSPGSDSQITAEGPLTGRAYRRQRFGECLPAVLVVASVACPFIVWNVSKMVAVVLLCGYLVYLAWLSLDMSVRYGLELVRMRRSQRVNWSARVEALQRPRPRLQELAAQDHLSRIEEDERRVLASWMRESDRPDPTRLWHLVVIPVFDEGPEILTPTLQAILAAHHPKDRVALCLSFEQRGARWSEETVESTWGRFRGAFGLVLLLRHPDGLPGEAPVKGANISWATRQARNRLHDLGIRDADTLVSVFDCDTRASSDYFSALAWTYLTDRGRDINAYQPVVLFHNNVWAVPAVSRLVGHLASLWNMGDLTRGTRTRIFSAHAAGMTSLVAVNFWAINVVPDDSRQYWRIWYASGGRSRVRPIHTPVLLDAVQSSNYGKTLGEQYLQILRWNYGVIDFPFIMAQNAIARQLPWHLRALQALRQLSDFHKRAATPILLFVTSAILDHARAGWLGPAGAGARLTSLIQSWTGAAGLLSVLVAVTVTLILTPAAPRHPGWNRLRLGVEWALVPVVLPVFFSVSALEAQFRLVLRRYLGFRVTAKYHRPSSRSSVLQADRASDGGSRRPARSRGLSADTKLRPDESESQLQPARRRV